MHETRHIILFTLFLKQMSNKLRFVYYNYQFHIFNKNLVQVLTVILLLFILSPS